MAIKKKSNVFEITFKIYSKQFYNNLKASKIVSQSQFTKSIFATCLLHNSYQNGFFAYELYNA